MDFYRIREEVSMIPTEPSTHISTEAKIPETLAQAQPEASSQSKPRTIRSIISRAAGPLKFLSFATGAVRFALPYGEKRDWVSPSTIASVGYYGDRLECAAAVTSLGKVIGDWRASRKAGTDTVASSPRPDVASGPHG